MATDEDVPGREVARAVLAALMATVAKRDYSQGFVLLPQTVPIESSALITRLVKQTKPITCVALPYGSAVAIGWWSMEADEAADHRDLMSEMMTDLMSADNKQDDRKEDALAEPRDEILLSTANLHAFLQDYHLPFAEYRIQAFHHASPREDVMIRVRVDPSSFGSISGGPLSQ